MQVNCSKCSQPIAFTDTIESDNGRLLHVDCKRPRALTWEERGLIFLCCSDHVVAQCPGCDVRCRYAEQRGRHVLVGDEHIHEFADPRAAHLAVDVGTNMCPRCRRDLTEAIRAHLFRCAMLPSEVRLKAHAVREAAQRLVKESRQARDPSDVLIREAEATLFECQRALLEAMSRRIASR